MRRRIMYIERKGDSLTGPARIGWVTFSKTGKTLYYRGATFQGLKGRGFKSNYFDASTGEEYWISGPRRDGRDQLYSQTAAVPIDLDAQHDYWALIRGRPTKAASQTI